jgi:hypothetical protein
LGVNAKTPACGVFIENLCMLVFLFTFRRMAHFQKPLTQILRIGQIARIFMVYSQYSLIGDIRVKDFGENFGL